jgi:hypothetical protein
MFISKDRKGPSKQGKLIADPRPPFMKYIQSHVFKLLPKTGSDTVILEFVKLDAAVMGFLADENPIPHSFKRNNGNVGTIIFEQLYFIALVEICFKHSLHVVVFAF